MAETTERVVIFIRRTDPQSEAALRYLEDHRVAYTAVDLDQDRQAAALLLSRLGQLTTPVIQIGDKLMVGFDPVQLARLLPQPPVPEEERVSFGAAVRSVSAELARERGLPATYGVEVGAVKPESPAETAGIRQGDLITDIGSFSLYGGAEQFRTAIAARKPGDSMQLSLWRDGSAVAVEVRFPEPVVTPAEG